MSWADATPTDRANAVRHASDFLTEYTGGTDWVNRINLGSLEMINSRRCILGQLFGGYMSTDAERVKRGFFEQYEGAAESQVWATYDDEWRTRIYALRDSARTTTASEPVTVSTSPFNSAELEMLMELVTYRLAELQAASVVSPAVQLAISRERARYFELQTAVSRALEN